MFPDAPTRPRGETVIARIPAAFGIVLAIAGVLFVAVAWVFAVAVLEGPADRAASTIFVALAFLYFAAISTVLSLIDLDTHRLPNSIVLPSYLVSILLLTISCLLGADWLALLRAAISMIALFGLYAVLRGIRPGGMGGGDVKLAGLIGIQLGWLGWGSVVVGTFAAFILGGLFGAILLLTRRAGRRTAIPFGPWMIAGSWVGIAVGESVSVWYVGLLVGA